MPGSRDDDLDWLYGRGPDKTAPEPTRVLPAAPGRDPAVPRRTAGARLGGSEPPAWDPSPAPPPPQTPAGPGRPGGPPPRRVRRRHRVRNTLVALLALVLAVVIWLVGVPAYAWSQVSRVDDTAAGKRPGNQPGKTFLLVGSDSREGLSKAQEKKLGTGDVGGQRTDTILLVYVPPTGKPALISLPRDSYLPIPGHGSNKINAAYAFGGPKLLEQTVEQSTGLRVDGYVEIGFAGFVNVIDAIDGIRMCLPNAISDRDSHLNVKKGCQTLNGPNALGYVRMRKADPRGDLGRVERQRQMVAAVVEKAASPATIANPVRYWRLCNAGAQAVHVGRDTSLLQVASMGLAMRKIANSDGLTLTVPIANPAASTPAGSAVLWDQRRAQDMFSEIARGDTSKLAKYAR